MIEKKSQKRKAGLSLAIKGVLMGVGKFILPYVPWVAITVVIIVGLLIYFLRSDEFVDRAAPFK